MGTLQSKIDQLQPKIDQLQQLNELWELHMQAMKRFLATGRKAELDEAERIAEQMKQIRGESQ